MSNYANVLRYALSGFVGGSVGGASTAISGSGDVDTLQVAITSIITGLVTLLAFWTRSPKDETVTRKK